MIGCSMMSGTSGSNWMRRLFAGGELVFALAFAFELVFALLPLEDSVQVDEEEAETIAAAVCDGAAAVFGEVDSATVGVTDVECALRDASDDMLLLVPEITAVVLHVVVKAEVVAVVAVFAGGSVMSGKFGGLDVYGDFLVPI
mmetsp:Transcript_27438/g.64312  ORF Transcript_27438/g.64312 Transcript_27438/m.64312 type:complete len:143 (+) Transcript_27438:1581-2009(+)